MPNTSNLTQCLSDSQILSIGGSVIENNDGTVSVFILNNLNALSPVILTKTCCEALNVGYIFDIDNQECRWSTVNLTTATTTTSACAFGDPFKLVLNPKGNDGVMFDVDNNDNCSLKIEFDYLFKIKCEELLTSISQSISPVSVFETLDLSVTLDIVTSANTLETVFEFPLFPAIGQGNLYNYLSGNTDSGFYVCGDPSGNETTFSACTVLSLNITGTPQPNLFTCNSIMGNIIQDLFTESGLSASTSGNTTFSTNISRNAFSSKWLNYNTNITDPTILALIANKKIKITIKINNASSDFCVLLDNIVLDSKCAHIESNSIFLTQSPGFELDRIIDNKKSWIGNTLPTNRPFVISNNAGTNNIRETKYTVNDERLVINTKEIDLDISLASGIEENVWYYMTKNPCLLTGVTCGNQTFMDGECYVFMDGVIYEFQNGNLSGGDEIPFNVLLTTPLSAITTVEDFEYFMTSELIDAKDRQTLSGYPTLRALYDRYMNSGLYCGNESAKFDYVTMDKFANLVGNYWIDIVEQVIPATTIWGSVKIYSNTVFDQQKFKYKAYTSFFGSNPFSGVTVPSPINGTSGDCSSVSVETSIITIPDPNNVNTNNPVVTNYNSVCLAQMNSNSEFLGTVTIIGPSQVNNENIINSN